MMTVIAGTITLLCSVVGLIVWQVKNSDLTEKKRQEKIDVLEKELQEASENEDYTCMRNLVRRINRLRK